MPYTSTQYKYLLIKRMQKYISAKTVDDRIYFQNFFTKLFDDSVTVDKQSYNAFNQQIDADIKYCYDHDIYTANSNTPNVETFVNNLVPVFKEIGITLTVAAGGQLTFTKPNGEVMKLNGGNIEIYINAKAGTEYNYAAKSSYYYQQKNIDVEAIEDIPFSAGIDTYWSYSSANDGELTITGNGIFQRCPTESQICGAYQTLIISASVSRLYQNCVNRNIDTMVVLAPAEADITIDPNIFVYSGIVVYTDNIKLQQYCEAVTIYCFPLSEWNEN